MTEMPVADRAMTRELLKALQRLTEWISSRYHFIVKPVQGEGKLSLLKEKTSKTTIGTHRKR
jgi:hypothetical protein